MTLCPEAEYRASLSDDEFWDYVYNGIKHDDFSDESGPEVEEPEFHPVDSWGRCPLCGEHGACGYDLNGEPMRHVVSDRED